MLRRYTIDNGPLSNLGTQFTMTSENRVAIVTGASAGIGKSIAHTLAGHGFRLALAARSSERLNHVREEVSQPGCDVVAFSTDVCDPNDLAKLVQRTQDHFGRIDVLINNAGVECFHHFEQLSDDQILQTIETNLTGAILLTKLVIPVMLEQKSGCIINMSSTAGRYCPAFAAVYGATKAGLIGFTEGLRGEYLDRGITATAICPGFTRDGGIYDRMVEATGRETSGALGGTTAEAVARAVLKAIQSAPPEVIVNWPPVRPALILKQLFPRLGEKIATAVSRRFTQRVADRMSRSAPQSDGAPRQAVSELPPCESPEIR